MMSSKCILAGMLLAVAVIGAAEGRARLRTGSIEHTSRGLGAAEWWDAVTGKDEHGDTVTTFMHKRWGTALQLYHAEENAFLQFRFVPHLAWLTKSESGTAQAVHLSGPGEIEVVRYWYAAKHLEELNAVREADTVLPDTMDLGLWQGERVGDSMVFSTHMHILNLLDDDFTDARYLVLTPEGFVYLGMMDSAITVQYDDKGQLKQPYGVSCALEEGIGYFSGALDLAEDYLPEVLGVPKDYFSKEMKAAHDAIKKYSVDRRANNSFARLMAPSKYCQGKDGKWEWCGKGTGNFLDGSMPYGS